MLHTCAQARPGVQHGSWARSSKLSKSGRRAARQICRVRNIDWPSALLFDCDGVLVDTEKDGHRVAFNQAFQERGLDTVWGVEEYGKLLETGGGKERMMAYFSEHSDREPFLSITGDAERKHFLLEMHALKTGIFQKMITNGEMQLREGVQDLFLQAMDYDVKLGVCSTSNENAVRTIVEVLLGPKVAAATTIFAGDVVPAKKPDPAIYVLAAETLGVDVHRCVVIEDSRIGLRSARAAGMRCVVTKSAYTQDEDFGLADAVFDCIGEGGDQNFSLLDLTTPGKLFAE